MYIFYDVETTGLNSMKHSIIQLGGIVEIGGKVAEEFIIKMQPHPKAAIEKAALRVSGVTEEELATYQKQEDAFKELVSILTKYVNRFDKTEKFNLVGFNNRAFDDNFLRMFFNLNDDKFIGSWFWMNTLDVSVLASQYLIDRRSHMSRFSLGHVATELDVEFDEENLHNALEDARLIKKIYETITGRREELF